MKKYQNRHLRKINNAINVAYLTTAILSVWAGCALYAERMDLQESYNLGEISKQVFLAQSQAFSAKEEAVFKDIANALGCIFASDVAFEILTRDREL